MLCTTHRATQAPTAIFLPCRVVDGLMRLHGPNGRNRVGSGRPPPRSPRPTLCPRTVRPSATFCYARHLPTSPSVPAPDLFCCARATTPAPRYAGPTLCRNALPCPCCAVSCHAWVVLRPARHCACHVVSHGTARVRTQARHEHSSHAGPA